MYALAIIRYRRPLDEVLVHHPAHREYLQRLKAEGVLVASGPLEPRSGGALLLRVPDDAVDETLNGVRDHDPYTLAGVGQYELLPWDVKTGRADLDRA
jgi:uncharacterized protein YciI